MRKNLVVVRAGKNSLHTAWLVNAENRSWDLIVSYYDDAEHEHPEDVRVVRRKGGKWDGLYVILAIVVEYEFDGFAINIHADHQQRLSV